MTDGSGPRLTGVAALDRDYLVVTVLEGEVLFKDDGAGPTAFGGHESALTDNWVVTYGSLELAAATDPAAWTIVSPDDPEYGPDGKAPVRIHRKTKISGMAQLEWVEALKDYRYETPLGHTLYLRLPTPLREKMRYQLRIDRRLKLDGAAPELVFDSFHQRSEAVHVNLVGYLDDRAAKTADLYHWLGDGGARDYAAFVDEKVFLMDGRTGERRDAGTVALWKERGPDLGGYDLTASNVWSADFGPVPAPGLYRIAIPGVGCSQDFAISQSVYAEPFRISVRGFYYMRIGEPERSDLRPIPRQPRYLPGEDPPGTKVLITTMHPYHPEWKTFSRGDVWDVPNDWDRFVKPGRPENPKARGGHSDALDWDRHLGHVSIVYDMLYPFLLTGGAIANDDCGIAESGNGVPDLLDEARNEVDFWLSLRHGDGYSHGLTNPNRENVLYQAENTVVAAWANAANAAMLAECFRIAGLAKLADEYRTHAATAYAYAARQPDQQLATVQDVGNPAMRGADFKMTAAAFLFNLTGEAAYEDAVNELSLATSDTVDVIQPQGGQIWATAGYLLSPRPSRYPALRDRMKASVLRYALEKEVALADLRPSRRATEEAGGYFHTAQNVHRTLLAHRICDDAAIRRRFLLALVREADWGLGRNPLNMIQMTTATTPLAEKRSVENAYTSGRNDGTPGLHPGHTPYFNMNDWGGDKGMIMARPSWMAEKGYPAFAAWPRGECAFNTRWVWAHSEFTPQQTMRGKMALYGYLYGLGKTGQHQA